MPPSPKASTSSRRRWYTRPARPTSPSVPIRSITTRRPSNVISIRASRRDEPRDTLTTRSGRSGSRAERVVTSLFLRHDGKRIHRALRDLATDLRAELAQHPELGHDLRHELAPIEDAHHRALRHDDRHRAGVTADRGGRHVTTAQAQRQLDPLRARGEVAAGSDGDPVARHDEGAVELRELLERLAYVRIDDLLRLVGVTLERVQDQRSRARQHRSVVVDREQRADLASLAPFAGQLQ